MVFHVGPTDSLSFGHVMFCLIALEYIFTSSKYEFEGMARLCHVKVLKLI